MVRYRDSDPEKWILKEHTTIKHEILGKYQSMGKNTVQI